MWNWVSPTLPPRANLCASTVRFFLTAVQLRWTAWSDDADEKEESTRHCVAWGFNGVSGVCGGWLLETEPDEIDYSYDQKYWYYEGGIYDPTDTVFDTCSLVSHTNLSVAHTKGARKKEGCFFKFVHLGHAKTPEDCQRMCENRT